MCVLIRVFKQQCFAACFKVFSRVFKGCLKDVLRVRLFQVCSTGVSRGFKGASGVFYGSLFSPRKLSENKHVLCIAAYRSNKLGESYRIKQFQIGLCRTKRNHI